MTPVSLYAIIRKGMSPAPEQAQNMGSRILRYSTGYRVTKSPYGEPSLYIYWNIEMSTIEKEAIHRAQGVPEMKRIYRFLKNAGYDVIFKEDSETEPGNIILKYTEN